MGRVRSPVHRDNFVHEAYIFQWDIPIVYGLIIVIIIIIIIIIIIYLLTKPRYVFDFRSVDQSRSKNCWIIA